MCNLLDMIYLAHNLLVDVATSSSSSLVNGTAMALGPTELHAPMTTQAKVSTLIGRR